MDMQGMETQMQISGGYQQTITSLDHLGRPTGGLAEISLDSTGSLPKGTDAGIDPPGWKGGQHPYHQQRGHLIAKNHGGSGVDPRNYCNDYRWY